MKVVPSVALVLCVLLLAAAVSFGQQKKKQEALTLRGEIIDTKCYLASSTGGGKGPEHKECAISCAKSGVPLGLLEDKTGTVYLIVKATMGSANDMLTPFIAERVSLKGTIVERGGVKMIVMDMIERTEP